MPAEFLTGWQGWSYSLASGATTLDFAKRAKKQIVQAKGFQLEQQMDNKCSAMVDAKRWTGKWMANLSNFTEEWEQWGCMIWLLCGVNYDIQTWTLTNWHSVTKNTHVTPNDCKIMHTLWYFLAWHLLGIDTIYKNQ
jgi:hypothetical protein